MAYLNFSLKVLALLYVGSWTKGSKYKSKHTNGVVENQLKKVY